MTFKEIATMIGSVGVPFAYYQFPNDTGQQPPFICFYYPRNNDFIADGKNYQTIARLIIELYTENKDFEKEAAIEEALTAHGLVFARDETFIDSEQMHETIYGMDVIITPENEG